MIEEKGTAIQTSTFDLQALAAGFPPNAETMLLDMRLTDEPAASSRLFRIYRPVPAHFHKTCDEYLQVISGRGIFVVNGGEPIELGRGQLLFFRRNVVHSIPEIVAAPRGLSVDTPRRDPADVHFRQSRRRHGCEASSARSKPIRMGQTSRSLIERQYRNHMFSPAISDAVAHASAFQWRIDNSPIFSYPGEDHQRDDRETELQENDLAQQQLLRSVLSAQRDNDDGGNDGDAAMCEAAQQGVTFR